MVHICNFFSVCQCIGYIFHFLRRYFGKKLRVNILFLQDTGQTSPRSQLTDDSEDDVSDLEISTGNKDTFILEVCIYTVMVIQCFFISFHHKNQYSYICTNFYSCNTCLSFIICSFQRITKTCS